MYRRGLACGVKLAAWQRFCAVVVPGNTDGRSDEFDGAALGESAYDADSPFVAHGDEVVIFRVERDHVEPARQWINLIPGLRATVNPATEHAAIRSRDSQWTRNGRSPDRVTAHQVVLRRYCAVVPGPPAAWAPALARSGSTGSAGLRRPVKVNFASSPAPSPSQLSTSTVTIWPGPTSSNRIFSDSWSSISRWMVRRSGRAPNTGSKPRLASNVLALSVSSSAMSLLFSWPATR